MEVDFSNSSKEEIEFFYKKISKNIKKYRLEKGLSQEKLALDYNTPKCQDNFF